MREILTVANRLLGGTRGNIFPLFSYVLGMAGVRASESDLRAQSSSLFSGRIPHSTTPSRRAKTSRPRSGERRKRLSLGEQFTEACLSTCGQRRKGEFGLARRLYAGHGERV